MPRIVFSTWGSLGDLHPYLALATELRRRGHETSVLTMGAWRERVTGAGVGFHPLRPDVSPEDPNAREIVRRLLDMREGPRYLFEEIFGPSVRETYEDTVAAIKANGGADLLVSHQVPITAATAAETTGVRWVSCVLLPMAFLSDYDPATPPQAPFLQPIAALHPSIAHVLNQIGRRVTRPWAEPLYRFRGQLGLPRGASPLFEGQHSPTLVLGLFSYALATKQPDYPPQTLITGFPFYDAAEVQPPAPELLRFLDAGDPPILFTLGSSAVWIADDFFHASIAAAQTLGRRALLLAADTAPKLRAEGLPGTIAAFEYAPHGVVMPRASAIVHQGGVGTTGQALRSGRPMLVVPFGQDQPDNARRCVALGVARTISRSAYKPPRVARELTALLNEPEYARRAAAVGEQVRAERGTGTAADAIERVLRE